VGGSLLPFLFLALLYYCYYLPCIFVSFQVCVLRREPERKKKSECFGSFWMRAATCEKSDLFPCVCAYIGE
jgi:hypothetical protein